LMVAMLIVFAIVAVELLQTQNKKMYIDQGLEEDDCFEALSSVARATILFFQTLVVSDAWGKCTLPLILNHPIYSIPILCGAFVVIQFGVTNLILSVVVQAADRECEADREMKMKEQKKMQVKAAKRIGQLFAGMDTDENGELTVHELMEGYDEDPRVRHAFEQLGVHRDDVEDCFHLMDIDNSGSLSAMEFSSNLHKAEVLDLRMQMMMLKLQLSKIANAVKVGFSKLMPLDHDPVFEPDPPKEHPPEEHSPKNPKHRSSRTSRKTKHAHHAEENDGENDLKTTWAKLQALARNELSQILEQNKLIAHLSEVLPPTVLEHEHHLPGNDDVKEMHEGVTTKPWPIGSTICDTKPKEEERICDAMPNASMASRWRGRGQQNCGGNGDVNENDDVSGPLRVVQAMLEDPAKADLHMGRLTRV